MSENPYEAPQTFEAPPQHVTDAEKIRKEHINTEASVKAIGTLYYLVCVMAMLSISGMLSERSPLGAGPMVATLAGVIILFFFTARGIRKFRPWSQIVVGALSGIALLAYMASGTMSLLNGSFGSAGNLVGPAVGMLINGYILRLIFAKKGRMIFSQPYKEIIAATPHIKYKTSKVIWILLGVIIAGIAIMIAAMALRGMK
jgi:hypothetical protein